MEIAGRYLTAEYITALATVGTLLVITATALAAFVQLRHLRMNNALMVLNDFREAYERPEMSTAREALPKVVARLQDPEARREFALGDRPEWAADAFPLLRLLETLGTYTNRKVVPPDLVCDMWSPVVLWTWTTAAPLIAVMRRTGGPAFLENFEMMAVLSQRWLDEQHQSYPRNLPRMKLIDTWAEEDGISSTPAGRAEDEHSEARPAADAFD